MGVLCSGSLPKQSQSKLMSTLAEFLSILLVLPDNAIKERSYRISAALEKRWLQNSVKKKSRSIWHDIYSPHLFQILALLYRQIYKYLITVEYFILSVNVLVN